MSSKNSIYLKPPVIYQGNKYDLLSWLRSLMPEKDIEVFVDLFGGSGVMSLNMQHLGFQSIYNEINPFYTKLYDIFLEEDIDKITDWIFSFLKETGMDTFRTTKQWDSMSKEERESSSQIYYKTREYLNSIKDNIPYDEWIIKCYSLSRMSAFNKFTFKEDKFQATAGKNIIFDGSAGMRKDVEKDIRGIKLFQNNFKDVIRYSCDYSLIINDLLNKGLYGYKNNEILLYLDPPYFGTNADYNRGWGKEQEDKLLLNLLELDKKGFKWMMSNAPNQHLKDFAEKHGFKTFEKRHIYSMGGGSKEAIEFLMINYEPPKQYKQVELEF